MSEPTVDLTKAAGSSAALAIMRTEAARRGCDSGTRDLTASEEAEATERSTARAIAMRSRAPRLRGRVLVVATDVRLSPEGDKQPRSSPSSTSSLYVFHSGFHSPSLPPLSASRHFVAPRPRSYLAAPSWHSATGACNRTSCRDGSAGVFESSRRHLRRCPVFPPHPGNQDIARTS